jgi:hypothetical protein
MGEGGVIGKSTTSDGNSAIPHEWRSHKWGIASQNCLNEGRIFLFFLFDPREIAFLYFKTDF